MDVRKNVDEDPKYIVLDNDVKLGVIYEALHKKLNRSIEMNLWYRLKSTAT